MPFTPGIDPADGSIDDADGEAYEMKQATKGPAESQAQAQKSSEQGTFRARRPWATSPRDPARRLAEILSGGAR